jgi:DNA helicase-2/ATP-dependent DNA helicase PcrA
MNKNQPTFNICEKRSEILSSNGHVLIEGGPGSGKTTIALLKAKELIDKGMIARNQKILFLSFARATVGRVEEQARHLITNEHKKCIEINTYHGFSWQIIQSYGYLLKKFRSLKLITPPNLFARTADLSDEEQPPFKKALLDNEGILCFDLFCQLNVEILEKSTRIRSIISDAYPYIIVDEFQDTDDHEWNMIKLLGEKSKIIALADLDQRIYEFRGASITRIPQFNEHFNASRFDLGKENNRSANTDIVQFGDDLLRSANRGKNYVNVQINKYNINYQEPKFSIKTTLSASIARLKKSKPGEWSIAVLVKSKQDTLQVSSYLSTTTRMPQYYHEVLIDPAGPALAANIIAQVLQPQKKSEMDFQMLLNGIISHIKGRRNNKISAVDLKLSQALEKYLLTKKITGKTRLLLIAEIEAILEKRYNIVLDGVPEDDWLTIRKLFGDCSHKVLKDVYEDAKYLRLLNKGAILSERLSEMWRINHQYESATTLIDEALTQEHFSMTNRTWKGIFVMTIHKSKGKEFDEVIIWDDQYRPIVSNNSSQTRLQQDRLVLRVAVTRAKSMTTFLTPANNPCILL